MFKTLTLLSFSLSALLAQDGYEIFQKKCVMCHSMYKPNNMEENKKIVAPPIPVAMRSVVIGVDAIEEPKDATELKQMSIEFLKDYIKNPSPEKGYCEDKSYKRFGTMPSVKGFISNEQIDIVVPWVYDNYSPKKDKNGKYKVSSKKK